MDFMNKVGRSWRSKRWPLIKGKGRVSTKFKHHQNIYHDTYVIYFIHPRIYFFIILAWDVIGLVFGHDLKAVRFEISTRHRVDFFQKYKSNTLAGLLNKTFEKTKVASVLASSSEAIIRLPWSSPRFCEMLKSDPVKYRSAWTISKLLARLLWRTGNPPWWSQPWQQSGYNYG